jgi:hypothetical protein
VPMAVLIAVLSVGALVAMGALTRQRARLPAARTPLGG